MSRRNDKLIQGCREVGGFADDIAAWIDTNEDLLGMERNSLRRHVRCFKSRVDLLEQAIALRPCVGIAGPSRSGKTHLVTGLVGRGPAPLLAQFDGVDERVDFLRQIRSQNQQLLGVVTRFSTSDPGTPTKFPVAVHLLSPVDVVKILGAAYLSASASHHVAVPTPADIESLAAHIGHQLKPHIISGMSEDDIWSIRDHFERLYAGAPVTRALAAGGYWDYVSAMVPRLPQSGRLALLSVLWGGLPVYNALYDQVVTALEKLGHESEAYCAMGALADVDPDTGRLRALADSIINVDALYQLGQNAEDTVLARSKHGAWAAIERSVLAAIVKEVRISLADSDGDLLARADILEFPGLQSPSELAGDAVAESRDGSGLLALFAKHKAAYLFEDYSDRREITSLAVCVDPQANDVGGLSHVVSRWVLSAHGATASDREKVDTSFFLVLTKLDTTIPMSDEDGVEGINWSKRMTTALDQGVSFGHDWATEWTPKRAFDNVYLLRSPHYHAPELCDYLSNGLELCVKSSRLNHVSMARDTFVSNTQIARHVSDPTAAWREAMEPGDGGVTYLAQSLAAVSNAHSHRRQIYEELNGLRHAMAGRLQRFYVSDDEFALFDTRKRAGHLVLRALQTSVDKQLLGRIMRMLHVPETEFSSLFYNLETNPYRANANYAPPTKPSKPSKRLTDTLNNMSILSDDEAALGADMLENSGNGDQADNADLTATRYARVASDYWASTLRTVTNAPDFAQSLGISGPALAFLVDELLAAAQRHDLCGGIAKRIQKGMTAGANMPQRTATAAIIAAESIGMFTNCLGFDESWADHHPRRKGRAQTAIFAPRQETGLASIGEVRHRLGQAFFADWSVAYMAMVEDNADNLKRVRLGAEADHDLGDLLDHLNPAGFWPAMRSA